jgi:NAD(P)-dependent dehydrogenase (short-subunit alcohol dehydrogenase family)
MNIAITGTSRGIGLELLKQALVRGDHVMAFARTPNEVPELSALQETFRNQLEISTLDVTQDESPERAAEAISAWTHLDIFINNAGVYRKGESADDFIDSFRVNSVAPYLITQSLFPKLKASSNPKSIQISSLMGSIEDNASGGSITYRASKAALNMITKTLALDEKWLTTGIIHPGWVQTRMGGLEASLTPTESVRGIWQVIQKLTLHESGSFYNYDGSRLPW